MMPATNLLQPYALDRTGRLAIACSPHFSIRNTGFIERELRFSKTGAVRALPTFLGYEA